MVLMLSQTDPSRATSLSQCRSHMNRAVRAPEGSTPTVDWRRHRGMAQLLTDNLQMGLPLF